MKLSNFKSITIFLKGLILAGSFNSTIAFSSDQSLNSDLPTNSQIDNIISKEIDILMRDKKFQSVSGAIYLDGFGKSFHYGKMDNAKKPNDNTLFEIGSLTKTYTGLLLAQAVHDGQINLDDAVTDHVSHINPEIFVKNGKTATIRDLATHMSGLPVNLSCGGDELTVEVRFKCYQDYGRDQFNYKLSRALILDPPGTKYRYSNAGIRLLSHIIEDTYSMSYSELLNRFIFNRSGETDTLFRLGNGDRERLAIGKNEHGNIMPNASEFYFGAGALKTSTASYLDHLTFYLESGAPIVELATKLIAGDMNGLGRAYVWNTFRLESEGMLYHAGGTFGTSSWAALYPKENMAIFLVTPLSSPNAQQLLNETSNRIIDAVRARRGN